MTQRNKIEEIIESYLKEKNFFLVDIVINQANEIDVTIDIVERSIILEDCIALSRFIEANLDREKEDYSLTVGSAGLDKPFKVFKQYEKFIGKELELVFKSGLKLKCLLTSAKDNTIEVFYSTMEKEEGKKRKVKKEVTQTLSIEELKSAKPLINFR